jgi:hypothetical protein
MGRKASWAVVTAILLAGAPAPSPGADAPEAITIRLIHPDRQLELLIDLFRGARAPHPAAALAAWRRATRDPVGLGKAAEAAIAVLNPEMVRELRTLDGAEVGIGFDPGDGHVRWSAAIPRDDGTFAALATALALTDGAAEPPLDGRAVDRLGPPGSALMARSGAAVALAGTRVDLAPALARALVAGTRGPDDGSGWRVRLVPDALGAIGPVPRRRAAEALRAIGCRGAEARASLDGEALSVALSATIDPAPGPSATVDPSWLDWVPGTAAAAAAIAIDPSPEAWDRAFAAADRVEKADPARAGVAPLRTRLNLIATAAGARPEVDLWPRLRGASACLLTDAAGDVEGAALALHADAPEAAARIAEQVIPRLSASLTGGARPVDRPDGVRELGRVSGRPLGVIREGSTVLLTWGASAPSACRTARGRPDRSASATIRAAWGPSAPHRAGAVWPGRFRFRAAATAGSPLAAALAEAPPVLWWGRTDGPVARDVVRWTDLRGLVRRFLDRLPLDPPPDH